jgi:MFS family permease
MTGDRSRAQPFRIRSLVVSVYLPSFLFAVGQGAVLPLIPLFALELGSSVAAAGAIVALQGLGMLCFDIPAGLLVARIGERGAMVVGTGALAAVAIGVSFSTSPLMLAPLVFVMGCAWSIWLLARLAYTSEVTPFELRGRVLSLLGGSNRLGMFVGPFIGGFIAEQAGLSSAFYVQAALAATAAALMFVVVPDEEVHARESEQHGGIGTVLRAHSSTFATAGVVTLTISALRSTRNAVIPLWGSAIGLDAGSIGAIFGLAAAVDASMFYPAGVVMDRFGRKWTAVPCLLILAAGLTAVPFTSTFSGLLMAGLLLGLGNGMGAGINMTLGADYAPRVSRAAFLGAWRLVGDLGTAGGPVFLSLLTASTTLGTATLASALIGVAGAAVMYRLVPEPSAMPPGRPHG